MIELIEQNFDNNNENCIEFLSGERFTTVSFSNRKHINRIKKIYEERKARYETRINAMLEYVTNDTLCRSRMLLDYFGEKNEHNCGQCDTCIGLRKQTATCQPDREELYEKIHEILSGAPQTPAGLLKQLPIEKELLNEALHRLLDEGKIIVVDGILQIKK